MYLDLLNSIPRLHYVDLSFVIVYVYEFYRYGRALPSVIT